MEKNRHNHSDKRTRMGLFQQVFVIMLIFGLFMSGCDQQQQFTLSASGKTYEVSPGFREFYSVLGGEDVLGPAISKLIDYDSMQCQYTSNVMLCLNPLITGKDRLSLYPLGTALKLGSTDSKNAFPVYEEFSDFYDQFSGEVFAGAPITHVQLNYKQQRIEQFFENVGFYRRFSDPPGAVHLIAYGAIHCAEKCNYTPALESSILGISTSLSEISLLDQLNKTEDISVFGKPLTQPYLASDGRQEQVYETVILYYDNKLNTVYFRPLPKILNMLTTEPSEKKFGKENGVVFYAVNNGLGYHVPIVFDDFINAHGGSLYSGDPIAEVVEYESGVYRQCFTNYCLEYSPTVENNNTVYLVDLGTQYLDFIQQSVLDNATGTGIQSAALTVDMLYTQCSSSELQRLDLFVYHPTDRSPIPGVGSELVVTMPDGSSWTSKIAPTQADGRTSIVIPAVKTIANGSIMNFEVCLKSDFVDPLCESGSYLIWNK